MFAAFSLLVSYTTIAQPPPIFDAPQKACGLLAAEGFAAPPWSPTSFGYECSSTNLRIDYIVSGDDGSKAKRIKLMLDLRYHPGKVSTPAELSSTGLPPPCSSGLDWPLQGVARCDSNDTSVSPGAARR